MVDKLPTISTQLKIIATVKASRQGGDGKQLRERGGSGGGRCERGVGWEAVRVGDVRGEVCEGEVGVGSRGRRWEGGMGGVREEVGVGGV